MIQKQVFKSLLLVLFLLNSSFILAQNETYWAITKAFPIKNPHLDSTYKSTAEKVIKEIKSLIIQNDTAFLWTNCFSEIDESIKDKDCNPVKLPKDYQNIELVGDSLLYIKLPLQNEKEFFLIYQKLGKEMPQSEILKFDNSYLSSKDSLILFYPRDDIYFIVEHYFKNIYKFTRIGERRPHNFYTILFIENNVLTAMNLASNENDFPEIFALDYFATGGIEIDKSLEGRFEKSDIEDFMYHSRRKYITWYFKKK